MGCKQAGMRCDETSSEASRHRRQHGCGACSGPSGGRTHEGFKQSPEKSTSGRSRWWRAAAALKRAAPPTGSIMRCSMLYTCRQRRVGCDKSGRVHAHAETQRALQNKTSQGKRAGPSAPSAGLTSLKCRMVSCLAACALPSEAASLLLLPPEAYSRSWPQRPPRRRAVAFAAAGAHAAGRRRPCGVGETRFVKLRQLPSIPGRSPRRSSRDGAARGRSGRTRPQLVEVTRNHIFLA